MPEIKAIDFIPAAVMRPHLVRSDHDMHIDNTTKSAEHQNGNQPGPV